MSSAVNERSAESWQGKCFSSLLFSSLLFSSLLFSVLIAASAGAEAARDDLVLAGAAELVELRSASARHYALPDGKRRAVIAAEPVQQRSPEGAWKAVDPVFSARDGSEDVVENTRFSVRSDAAGLAVTDPSGAGIRWLLPGRAVVDGATASVTDQGVVWSHSVTRRGTKVEAVVASSRGAQTYRFPFALEGAASALRIDSAGRAIVPGTLVVPRPIIYGADDRAYDAGPWSIAAAGREAEQAPELSFTFDDSTLPKSAFPYRIDPGIDIVPAPEDGAVSGFHASDYAAARETGSIADTSATSIKVGQRKSGNAYRDSGT